MNKEFVNELHDFGRTKPILPLKEAGNITYGNATRLPWEKTCPKNENDEIYILGNPPYLGARLQDAEQKKDMGFVFHNIRGFNNMDYISCWFYKAKEYIADFNAECAFVSTNSICQGEQVALIWPNILSEKIEIGFAHQSFKWTNNAKGNAGVIVIIVSIRNKSSKHKFIYIDGLEKRSNNINPYLVDAKNTYVQSRSKPISKFPEINFGSMANDGGNLLLSEDEKNKLLELEPKSEPLLKNLVGALEFIRGKEKYCLWIDEDDKDLAYSLPMVKSRIDATEVSRLNSKRKSTQELASVPYKFAEVRYLTTDSIIVPSVSSERRDYIPIGFLDPNYVIVAPNFAVYNAEIWIFGILTSKMHMVWVKNVSGKLKTDYRYSAKLCYNTFPFPEINQKQKEQINLHVFEVLEEREKHSSKTLAQLYDPNKMPKGLKEAHHQLDLAIERCYRLKPFESDTERLEYLFKEYEKMIHKNTLLEKPKRTRKKKG
jgi:hypothetical protein